jgi:DnaJ-class molecular chaperone
VPLYSFFDTPRPVCEFLDFFTPSLFQGEPALCYKRKVEQRDYYQILEVENNSDQRAIREAYRKLAFQYHPDRNTGNPSAAEKMKGLNEAYAVLSDKKKRGEYDTLRQQFGESAYGQFRQNYSDQDIFRGSDVNRVFEEMARAFGFRSFDEIFRACYGEDCKMFEFRRSGFFGRGFVFVGPSAGRSARRAPSPPGGNWGKVASTILKKVGGIELPQKGKDWQEVVTLHPLKAREGGDIRYVHRRKSKELVVKLPPGIREGQRIRLRGMGADGIAGGEPGDLYLKIRFKKTLGQKVRDLLKRIQLKAKK